MKRGLALLGLVAIGSGCNGIILTPVHGAGGGGGASPVVERFMQGAVDKIDLLLVVDNSASMADKQQILALAVPDLISGFVNPPCLDDVTNKPVAMQPAASLDACPPGSVRAFAPVLDMHVGVLSSSLGSYGADGCPDKSPAKCPNADTTPYDDHGHLVTRSDSCDSKGPIPTYQSEGFLAWDPAQMLAPPGIQSIGAAGTMGPGSGSGIVGSVHDVVVGDGQDGCGFESQNESWYRFLVDPTPYQSIELVNNEVQTDGVDQALLQQRQQFLRPDSLLVIVNLSDETDTSIKHEMSFPLFAAPELHLPHPRQECLTKGPTDPCCASCGQPTPAGCPPDPACTSDPSYTSADENTQIRAFGLISHKARYGIEFFYPPSRYVQALTSPTVTDAEGKTTNNPVYTNLDPIHYTGAIRDPSMVFYAAIVGVPWQLIARQNASGKPDLVNGVSAIDASMVGGFKSAAELARTDSQGFQYWDDIAGDPENYVPARSPFMQESTIPRSGFDPITGIAISPTSSANGTNPINGHEWTISKPANDIEYACTFPLPQAIDESGASVAGDCGSNPIDNPLCSPNPNDGMKNTLQTGAKAYPGIKHLAIARGLKDQGIVGSICPAQLTDPTKPDFGYRPAVRAIVDAVTPKLRGPCFPRALTPNSQGLVSCVVLEGRKTAGACDCDPNKARAAVTAAHMPIVSSAQEDPVGADQNCWCEIEQASGAALQSCQTDANTTANGWCYVDAAEDPASEHLVAGCPAAEKREIRFVGTGQPLAGASVFISCQ